MEIYFVTLGLYCFFTLRHIGAVGVSKGIMQECRVKKVQSVLSLEVVTTVFIPIPPVFPLNHIYLEHCYLGRRNLLTNILFYYPFFQTQNSNSLLLLTLCQRESNGWTLAWLGRSNNEMYLLCLGEWWLKCMCTFHLSKMLTYQAIWLKYWFFSGTQAEMTLPYSPLPRENGFFIKLGKLKLAIG